jgi:uncharacterized linocin/CFP29 family protein
MTVTAANPRPTRPARSWAVPSQCRCCGEPFGSVSGGCVVSGERQPLDLTPAQDAAEAVADREEEFVYRGQPDLRLPGLLTHEGRQELEGGDWASVERALGDVLAAVTQLDDAGYRGPYALALAPPLYNGLFRLYPGSDVSQIEHLRRLCTRGIYKAPIESGVLVDPRVGVLVLGQHLQPGYISQDGVHHELYLIESIVLRIDEPPAICRFQHLHQFAPCHWGAKPEY